MTKEVENGSVVKLHYVGTNDDGTEFDSSRSRGEPMSVVVGSGQLIEGFNDALVGMTTGETKTFTLTPEDAYGEVNPEAYTILSRGSFPDDFSISEGVTVPLTSPMGQNVVGTITEYDDEEVTVDLNHPMAGKNLTFEVEVLSVESDTE
jgi:peptidylprolyl isomerase